MYEVTKSQNLARSSNRYLVALNNVAPLNRVQSSSSLFSNFKHCCKCQVLEAIQIGSDRILYYVRMNIGLINGHVRINLGIDLLFN